MQNNIQQDTIDFRELFPILKRRKRLIWSMTTFFTLVALVYIFITKPIYEVSSMIEIGQIDAKPIDDINDIKQKLSYEYQLNEEGIKIELPFVKSISIPKKSTNILSLTIYANNNQEGIKYIQTVINKIETQYKEKTDAYQKSQKKFINLIQKDIEENTANLLQMKKELHEYSQKITSIKSQDAALAGIYVLQIGQVRSEIQELKKHISTLKTTEQELKASISPLMMKPTHIVGNIKVLDNPVKPKKALIFIVAFITGLMFSVFLAFFLEFLRDTKE